MAHVVTECMKFIYSLVVRGLQNVVKIEQLQDRMQEMLCQYEDTLHQASHGVRFGRILLAGACIGRVPKKIIEHLFFKPDIMCVPVANILNNLHLSQGYGTL